MVSLGRKKDTKDVIRLARITFDRYSRALTDYVDGKTTSSTPMGVTRKNYRSALEELRNAARGDDGAKSALETLESSETDLQDYVRKKPPKE